MVVESTVLVGLLLMLKAKFTLHKSKSVTYKFTPYAAKIYIAIFSTDMLRDTFIIFHFE